MRILQSEVKIVKYSLSGFLCLKIYGELKIVRKKGSAGTLPFKDVFSRDSRPITCATLHSVVCRKYAL
jgi:hypothetical protein